jgi:hypothetical protein
MRNLFNYIALVFLFAFCNKASVSEKHAAFTGASYDMEIETYDHPGDSVKRIKSASVEFKVKDVQSAADSISSILKRYEGAILDNNFYTELLNSRTVHLDNDSVMELSAYRPRLTMQIKVPSEQLEYFIRDALSTGYYVDNSRFTVDDKSLDYLLNTLKIRNRKNVEKKSDHVLYETTQIYERDKASEILIQNKTIDYEVQYSQVSLNVYQNALVHKETMANTNLNLYRLSVGKQFTQSFQSGWLMFLGLINFFIHIWPLILLTVLIWVILRQYKSVRKPVRV